MTLKQFDIHPSTSVHKKFLALTPKWMSSREPDAPLSPVFQYIFFAGQELQACRDEESDPVSLHFLGMSSGSLFPTMEEAKAAAPEFARQVLRFLSNRIT
jgi:hypothetical protein